ncbi:MAG: glycosyltransferase family 1 protein [Chloroflexi bacterium]|nr:MAG: glycosyltransferase family 1 protein [Chloroflexota bacterium]
MICWPSMPLNRLAIDASRALTHPRTGTEWYSLEIIRALASLHSRPALRLYIRSDQDRSELPEGVQVRAVGMPRLWTHVGLSVATRRDQPDALFIPSHVIPAIHPRVSVVTVHDIGYKVEQHAHTRRSRVMLDMTTRWSVRVASRVIAVSEQTKRDLVHHYGVRPDKVHTVHSGVNRERFHPLPPADVTAHLSRYDISQPYILFMSTIQPRKNLVRLVEAFEQLDDPTLQLVIAGKPGWLSAPIEARVAGSPRVSTIRRVGYVDDASAAALYAGAACFALPSLYEGFGMGILEAMASGTPVVTSNLSSMSEVAADAAVLVDPFNVASIRQGLEQALDPLTRERLVRAGYRRAAAMSWDHCARSTLRVLWEAYDAP